MRRPEGRKAVAPLLMLRLTGLTVDSRRSASDWMRRSLLMKEEAKARKWVLRMYVILPTYHPCSHLPSPERIAAAIEQPHIEGGANKRRKNQKGPESVVAEPGL